MKIKIISTDDGSSTIYNEEIDETYHSTHGAIAESQHVFIKNGLEQIKQDHLTIFEIGFGTGLNAFLSAIWSYQNQVIVKYVGVEKYPLNFAEVKKLNYPEKLGFHEVFEKLHQAEWGNNTAITQYFSMCKLNMDVLQLDFKLIDKPDIIYFDAFSPTKQPELWEKGLFLKLFNSLTINGILVTYSASGIVKQALRGAGFKVKRLPGPPGKHHMLVAKKEIQL